MALFRKVEATLQLAHARFQLYAVDGTALKGETMAILRLDLTFTRVGEPFLPRGSSAKSMDLVCLTLAWLAVAEVRKTPR